MKRETLSTRQVAALLAVGEATVKRWADAGEIGCVRTPGGHRKFQLREVASFVGKRGIQVRGTALSEVPDEALRDPAETSRFVERAALQGDSDAVVAALSARHLMGEPVAAIFDRVLAPALVRIGESWEACKLSVAEEHVATQAIIDAIARAQALAEPSDQAVKPRHTAVAAACAGEQHDLGPRMAACLLRARGHQVLSPLAQTPPAELANLVARVRARVVALGSHRNSDLEAVQRQVDLCAEALETSEGTLFLGGAGTAALRLPARARRVASMAEFERELDRL